MKSSKAWNKSSSQVSPLKDNIGRKLFCKYFECRRFANCHLFGITNATILVKCKAVWQLIASLSRQKWLINEIRNVLHHVDCTIKVDRTSSFGRRPRCANYRTQFYKKNSFLPHFTSFMLNSYSKLVQYFNITYD